MLDAGFCIKRKKDARPVNLGVFQPLRFLVVNTLNVCERRIPYLEYGVAESPLLNFLKFHRTVYI